MEAILAALAPVVPFILPYCEALGLHVVNPGPFCRWANRACSKFCYARNSVRRWKNTINRTNGRRYMMEAIQRDADRWMLWAPMHFRKYSRVRVASRFEPFNSRADVEQVRSWVVGSPDTLFWIVTRSWIDPTIRQLVQDRIMCEPNARVLGSIDRLTTQAQYDALCKDGWSTMGVWNRNPDFVHPFNPRAVRCIKTFGKVKGACKTCSKGCFSAERTDVHLLLHS